MDKIKNISSVLLVFSFCIIGLTSFGQNESILDFTVKKLNGDTLKLRDNLDPNANYIIETMAFWCEPCIRSIDEFNYHKNYWKERFNVNILLLEDEHWDDLPFVESKMEELGWDLEIVVSNDQFSTVGINSIPKYFFKGVASDSVEVVSGNIEKFLIERVDSIKYEPILENDFKQVSVSADCEQLTVFKFDASEDIDINGNNYKVINDIPFRESDQNGNIIRFNSAKGEDETYIKFSSALCSRIWLKDLEGDSLLVKILDRYQQDSVLHVVTDQVISNECPGEEVSFELVQNIGTNAGFNFNIENGRIISRLICHKQEEELIFIDDELGIMCQSLSTKPLSLDQLNIQVYPNPVRSNLQIKLYFDGKKKIEIINSNGQILVSKNTENNEIELDLPKQARTSLLLLKITTKYGVVTKKVLRLED